MSGIEDESKINSTPWYVMSNGNVGSVEKITNKESVGYYITPLNDRDIAESLKFFNSPEILGNIFIQQARMLGYTQEEIEILFSNITKKDLSSLIKINVDGEGEMPDNKNNTGRFCGAKLNDNSYDSLLKGIFHTPGIIQVYPHRTDDIIDTYSTINHEVNHLVMIALYNYRNKKKGLSIQESNEKSATTAFAEFAETLAHLDGGGSAMNLGETSQIIQKHIGGPEYQLILDKYYSQINLNNTGYSLRKNMHFYDRARLRALRIHNLQIRIYNLKQQKNDKDFQKWCKVIRSLLWESIDSIDSKSTDMHTYGFKIIDMYLDQYETNPEQAQKVLLSK